MPYLCLRNSGRERDVEESTCRARKEDFKVRRHSVIRKHCFSIDHGVAAFEKIVRDAQVVARDAEYAQRLAAVISQHTAVVLEWRAHAFGRTLGFGTRA